MLESTPFIISITIILAAVIGGVIGHLLSKVSSHNNKDDIYEDSNQDFHVDGVTGIVSDASSVKYHR